MSGPVLLDIGPLVAYFDRREQHHQWAYRQFETRLLPFLTCEPVLTEAAHLLKRFSGSTEAILELIRRDAIRITYAMQPEAEAPKTLLARYDNVPMDLADACLVQMNEHHAESEVLTLDADFHIYRTCLPLCLRFRSSVRLVVLFRPSRLLRSLRVENTARLRNQRRFPMNCQPFSPVECFVRLLLHRRKKTAGAIFDRQSGFIADLVGLTVGLDKYPFPPVTVAVFPITPAPWPA